MPQGFRYVPFNDINALRESIGPHTCAVMLEPVQGEGGVHVADKAYLEGVRALCDELGLLLIFDEVQCGLGRTGKLFAYEHHGVEPDIFTLAKALGGGFPIGAMIGRANVSPSFVPGDHASTFGGNPLASAAGLAVLEQLLHHGVVENAASVGSYLKEQLEKLQEKWDFIVQVRGKGLLLGMELSIPGKDVVAGCQEAGLLINCVNNNVLRFIPPLIITQEDADFAIQTLDKVLAEVSHGG